MLHKKRKQSLVEQLFALNGLFCLLCDGQLCLQGSLVMTDLYWNLFFYCLWAYCHIIDCASERTLIKLILDYCAVQQLLLLLRFLRFLLFDQIWSFIDWWFVHDLLVWLPIDPAEET